MRTDTWMQVLPCKLTEVECDERARAASRLSVQLALHKNDCEAAKKKMDQEKKRMETDHMKLAVAAHSGTEDREVECYEMANVATMRIETIRIDIGEVVGSHDMNESERKQARQGKLDLPDTLHESVNRARREETQRSVTELEAWQRRRELNRIDRDIAGGIPGAAARAAIKRPAESTPATDGVARGPFGQRDQADAQPASPQQGTLTKPAPLPAPIVEDDTAPAPPGDQAGDDVPAAAPKPDAALGTVKNPAPLQVPPPDEQH